MRFEVGALRNGLAELFALPDGYEILLGNGGTTCFWDAASFGLDRAPQPAPDASASSPRSSPTSCARRRTSASRRSSASEPGTHPLPVAEDGIDAYCLTHNETSTGVAMPIDPAGGRRADEALVLVDATSGAGGLRVDLAECDVYYFAPQKCLAADGGLWLAAVSPAADRAHRADRRLGPLVPGVPRPAASPWSRAGSTRPTTRPALATILLAREQVDWICRQRRARVGGVAVRPLGRRPSTAGPTPTSWRRRS